MAVEMEQDAISAAPVMSAAPKKKPSKVVKSKSAHPTWVTMIESAVKELNDKGGSSIPSIKKFILANNTTIDKARLTFNMRRAVKTLTTNGTLIQAKGHGLTGSFKLGGLKTKAPKKESGATEDKKGAKKEGGVKINAMRAVIAAPLRKAPKINKAKNAVKTKEIETKKPAAEIKEAPAPLKPEAKKPAEKKLPVKAKVAAVKAKDAPVEAKVAPSKANSVAFASKANRAAPVKVKVVPVKVAPTKVKVAPAKAKVNKTAKQTKSPKPKTIKKVPAKPKSNKTSAPK